MASRCGTKTSSATPMPQPLGFITLRFDYAMVLYDWATVEAAILAILAQDLHRTPAGMRMDSATRG